MKRSFKEIHDFDLSRRFRSKADFYAYLTQNLQYYLPPISNINKDFLKQIFTEKKKILRNEEVKRITVPLYDELNVTDMFEIMKGDSDFMLYMPDRFAKGRQLDRSFFFNVFNTIRPERLSQYLKHARSERIDGDAEEIKKERITISEDWYEQLNAIPFQSKSRGRTVFLLKQKAKPTTPGKKRKRVERLDEYEASQSAANTLSKSYMTIDQRGVKKIVPELLQDKM